MIALEKLLLLKSVTFFKQTPDELLMKLILYASEEVFYNAGQLIFKQGEIGKAMYVIAKGKVSVHDEKLVITELGEREIFGELAALSFGKRTSSVSALSDVLLLKISSIPIYEAMALDIGLAKGIIKALCERAQSMSMQLHKQEVSN